jgi:hypothetical protein
MKGGAHERRDSPHATRATGWKSSLDEGRDRGAAAGPPLPVCRPAVIRAAEMSVAVSTIRSLMNPQGDPQTDIQRLIKAGKLTR